MNGSERICMYTPSARGGHPLYSWELLTALTNHPSGGSRFELVSSEDLEERFRDSVYPVHAILPPLSHRGQFANKVSWAFSRTLHYPRREHKFLDWLRKRPDIDAVHFQEFAPLFAASFFRRVRSIGKRVFCTVHNLRPHSYPPMVSRSFWDRCHFDAWRLCDGLFVLTEQLAQQVSELLGSSCPPVYVAPHGVWTLPDKLSRPTREERLSWKRLLFFGTIRRNKGVDLLLGALEQLPGYRVTIAGEPLDRDYFRNEIVPRVNEMSRRGFEIDLQPRFSSDAEAARLFNSHSAIVLPYTKKFQSQSGVLFLALAHEMPVIASGVGGVGDLLSEYRVGVAFTELSADGVAEAIRRFFEGPSEFDWEQAIQTAKQRFSWSEAATATLGGYAARSNTKIDARRQ